MSCNGPRSFCSRFSRHLLLFIPVLILLIIPFAALAQDQMPRDFRREEARLKAELFERMHLANISQTANQADYDVTYYDIDLDIDPVSEIVTGTVTVTATVTGATLSTVDLDLLSNMTVTGAAYAGGPLAFSHVGDILTVTLPMTPEEAKCSSV